MKTKIALRILGHKAPDFDVKVFERWKSKLWELHEGSIDTLPLNGEADLPDWGYSDAALADRAICKQGADLTICILNVPLEDNYYFRRIDRNLACASLFEIGEVLRGHNIPVENFVFRMIYSCTLIYARKKYLPPILEIATYTHHETKGCIFDMTGIKTDVSFSCDRPILCGMCRVDASANSVTKEFLDTYELEISKIEKRLYFQITDLIKRRPILAILLSSTLALLIGTLGSLVASIIYEKFKEPSQAIDSTAIRTISPEEQEPSSSHP